MNQLLVVGFGNTLRGDDGLGPQVVAGLSSGQFPDNLRARAAAAITQIVWAHYASSNMRKTAHAPRPPVPADCQGISALSS